MGVIYLDHSSTTPTAPAVLEAMSPYWTETFGNPASAHGIGRRARMALENARENVAALLGASPSEVIFTSGATEANNLAIHGLAGQPASNVLVSSIEHPSVLEPVVELGRRGFRVDRLRVDAAGVVEPSALTELLHPDVCLVAVMLANHETGAVQPIHELVGAWRAASASPAAFHCDAVQAVGKLPVHFQQLGVTTLSLSAHKFNGPRGVGALLVRKPTKLRPLFAGGHQQQGQRPGTEPVVLAVGLAKALELACAVLTARDAQVRQLREALLTRLAHSVAPIALNGPRSGGLPHILNLSFPGCDAAALLIKLDLAGVACATGAACSSGSLLPSPVLQAMNCPPDRLASAIRFSLSHLLTVPEIETAATRIAAAVRALRECTALVQ